MTRTSDEDAFVRRGEFVAKIGSVEASLDRIEDGQKFNNRLTVSTLITVVLAMLGYIGVHLTAGVQVHPAAAYASEHRPPAVR